MFGLTIDKLLIIGVLAVFLLGPERLPYYASQLAKLVRTAKTMADGAKQRMRDEMGPDFDEVDWKKLDPRQYDPRRIIREALIDEPPAVVPDAPRTESAYARRQRRMTEAAAAASAATGVASAESLPATSSAAGPAPVVASEPGSSAGSEPAFTAAVSSTPYDEEAT